MRAAGTTPDGVLGAGGPRYADADDADARSATCRPRVGHGSAGVAWRGYRAAGPGGGEAPGLGGDPAPNHGARRAPPHGHGG